MRIRCEPVPTDIQKVFKAISGYHGPNRYAAGAGEINAGVAHLESSPTFTEAIRKMDFSVMPDRGEDKERSHRRQRVCSQASPELL